MEHKKIKWIITINIIIVFLVSIIVYTIWDNGRVVVDNVTMSSKNLPSKFDGYRILQISDLHAKSFGDKQEDLIKLINKQEYDLLLFTGDYIEDNNPNLQPLEDLLKGLPKKGEKYFVLGNADEINTTATLVKGNKFFDLFNKYGIASLYPGAKITKGNDSIWLLPNPYKSLSEIHQEVTESIKKAENDFKKLYNVEKNPFTIEVSHVPTEINFEREEIKDYRKRILGETDDEWIDWDMSISGHTHGGQIHLPFIGPAVSPNNGLFPGRMNIIGVHEYNEYVQYVNSGLGVSGPKLLQFRFLNPPAIGLIELRKAPNQ